MGVVERAVECFVATFELLRVRRVQHGKHVAFDSKGKLCIRVSRPDPLSPFVSSIPYLFVEQGYRDAIDEVQPIVHAGGLRSAIRFAARAREQQSGLPLIQDNAGIPGTLHFRYLIPGIGIE